MSVKKERERKREGAKERESAESDQYSNCKMNLTGARTSHQMGKEIGYERWPAIKSDIPQCHLSDSGWGIMTTANESWALVRRWFKSAPRCVRLAVLTQSHVLYPAQLGATEYRSGKPSTLSQTVSSRNRKGIKLLLRSVVTQVLEEVLYSPQTNGEVRISYRTALVELMDMNDSQGRDFL